MLRALVGVVIVCPLLARAQPGPLPDQQPKPAPQQPAPTPTPTKPPTKQPAPAKQPTPAPTKPAQTPAPGPGPTTPPGPGPTTTPPGPGPTTPPGPGPTTPPGPGPGPGPEEQPPDTVSQPPPPPEPVPTPPPPAPTPPPVEAPSKYPDGWRLMLSDLTLARYNPVGLETRARFGLQKKLYPSTSPATENNFVFIGLSPKLNPASAHIAAAVEIQPASIFNLRLAAGIQQYFGSFGYLQSFKTAASNYSDRRLAFNKDNPNASTEPQAALIGHVSIHPMLQLKFGKIAVRALLQLDYWELDVRPLDVVAYEPTVDTLLPDGGWTLQTDTDVLYVTGTGLVAGLRHTWVHPFYEDRHFENAAEHERVANDNAHQRIGFFGAYTLRDDGPSTFNKPTIVLIVSWYLFHKYRAGEPTILPPDHMSADYKSRVIPYVLLGFAFESDFLAVN